MLDDLKFEVSKVIVKNRLEPENFLMGFTPQPKIIKDADSEMALIRLDDKQVLSIGSWDVEFDRPSPFDLHCNPFIKLWAACRRRRTRSINHHFSRTNDCCFLTLEEKMFSPVSVHVFASIELKHQAWAHLKPWDPSAWKKFTLQMDDIIETAKKFVANPKSSEWDANPYAFGK